MQNFTEIFKINEQEAFNMLFETYYDRLLLYAVQILNDVEAAADVVQERFIDFWEKKRYLHISGDFEGYLFSSVKNASLNYLRSDNTRRQYHEKAEQTQLHETMPYNEELWDDQLYRAIGQLPEERRKIFTMATLDGMKYQEIADSLNISLNTVKKQMSRSFQFLREHFNGKIHSFLLVLLNCNNKSGYYCDCET